MGPDAQSPYDRNQTNGFRCAKNPTPVPDEARAPLDLPYFDFAGIEPVGDDEYKLLTRFYDYDPVALEALVEAADTSEFWIRQRVSYTAAYGEERVVAFVFLPRNVDPPYQSVVFFPGLGAFLRAADMVKFAKHRPELGDCAEALAAARRFVETTAPRAEEVVA